MKSLVSKILKWTLISVSLFIGQTFGNGHIQAASGLDVMVLAGSPNVPPMLEKAGH